MPRMLCRTSAHQYIRQGCNRHNQHHLEQGAPDLRVYVTPVDVLVGQGDHESLSAAQEIPPNICLNQQIRLRVIMQENAVTESGDVKG